MADCSAAAVVLHIPHQILLEEMAVPAAVVHRILPVVPEDLPLRRLPHKEIAEGLVLLLFLIMAAVAVVVQKILLL